MVKPLTYGRMGNFLFQAATAMAYAWDHNLPFTLPTESLRKDVYPVYLQHLVNPNWNPDLPTVVIKEKEFSHQSLPYMEEWRNGNVVLDGYWQTEKYFKHHRSQLLKAFGLQWLNREGKVSVHVRRGDYLRLPHKHPPVSQAWYSMAMRKFVGYHFIFFSDDIAWCKESFGKRGDVSFAEGKTEVDDLVLMSECEHHICSASTFSWWGAWLNQNPKKRVIIPLRWFTPGWKGMNTKDVIPQEWEKL